MIAEQQAARAREEKQSIKCVVWDLDNTIWDGILLEDAEVTLRAGVLEAIRESRGTAIAVTDAEIRQAQGEIAREVGLYTGPEGAATWAALGRLHETGYLNGNEDVVLFATSIGTKY